MRSAGIVARSIAVLVAALVAVLLAPGRPAPVAAAGLPDFACTAQSGGGGSGGTPVSVTAARAGAQSGYDRFVLQFDGPLPAYTVQPRSSAIFTEDPRGEQVTLAGAAGVQVTVRGASVASGVPTALRPNLTILKEARQVGSFEGVATWGLGVDKSTCLRVFTLPSPNRLVVDVRHYGLPAFTCDGGVLHGIADDQGVPPPAVVTDVRTGRHDGYDRFVTQLAGLATYGVVPQATPTFTVAPGDGRVTLQGTSGVRVVISAYAAPNYTGPTDIAVGLPALREVRQVQDYEGTVEWALGVEGSSCLRAFALRSPTRLVVDVAR